MREPGVRVVKIFRSLTNDFREYPAVEFGNPRRTLVNLVFPNARNLAAAKFRNLRRGKAATNRESVAEFSPFLESRGTERWPWCSNR